MSSGRPFRLLARDAVLNLIGQAAPLAAALVAVPYLASALGVERFGMLSLAWVLVGYFSLFDFGLGRALTRTVAAHGASDGRDLAGVVTQGLAAMLALGVASGAALFLLAPVIAADVLRMPADLRIEAVWTLRILAACLPFVTVTAGLRGILEGKHRFVLVNAIRIPLGLLTFLAPMMVAAFSPGLVPIAIALAVVRVAAAVAHWIACLRSYPELFASGHRSSQGLRQLFAFGAWLTVSNVVGPLMVYSDRFVLGAVVGLAAVGYYSAPYEVVTRLWLVPAALTAVLFPAITAQLGANPDRTLQIYRWGLKFVFLGVFPITLCLAVLAPDWLRIWLGAEYAEHSANAARLLVLGVLINCLAYIPFTFLQSAGRADLTAKAHLAELPPYLILLLWLAGTAGIDGAALAWSLRCAADCAILFVLARRHLSRSSPVLTAAQWGAILLLVGLVGAAAIPVLSTVRLPLLLVGCVIYGVLGWFVLLSPVERDALRDPWRLKNTLSRP
jgi:O-antigen/teichoic acid export membrane protein